MKVVLDTNILISAVIEPTGTPAQILLKVSQGMLELIISEHLLAELEKALTYPRVIQAIKRRRSWSKKDIKKFLNSLRCIAKITHGNLIVKGVSKDPDDDWVLSAAKEGKAKFLITGNKQHLLSLKTFQDIKIITAADFKKILNSLK